MCSAITACFKDPNLMSIIMKDLPYKTLLNLRFVSKNFKLKAETEISRQCILCKEQWGKNGVPIEYDIPLSIEAKEWLKDPCNPSKGKRLLVFMPVGISEAEIGKLFLKLFPQNTKYDGFRYLDSDIKNHSSFNAVVEKAYWVGIIMFLPGSDNLNFEEAKKFAKDYKEDPKLAEIRKLNHVKLEENSTVNQEDGLSAHSLPQRKVMEAAALLKFVQNGERILKIEHNENKLNGTWCEETVEWNGRDWGTAVYNFTPLEKKENGGFAPGGPGVNFYYLYCCYGRGFGAAVVRKFGHWH